MHKHTSTFELFNFSHLDPVNNPDLGKQNRRNQDYNKYTELERQGSSVAIRVSDSGGEDAGFVGS